MPRKSKYSDEEKANIIFTYKEKCAEAKAAGKKKPAPKVSLATLAKWSRELNGAKSSTSTRVFLNEVPNMNIAAPTPKVTLQAQGALNYIMHEQRKTREYLAALESCEENLVACLA